MSTTETNEAFLTVYLCGGINGLTDSECRGWRDEVKEKLAGRFNFLDPMRRDYRGKEIENMNDIVNLDLADIHNSDILLVNAARPSWGTAMEVFFAHTQQKQIVTICPDQRPSPWLVYHSDLFLPDLESALAYLGSINATGEIVSGEEIEKRMS